MRRWNTQQEKEIENSKIDAFLTEIAAVCRKHSLSISHEDGHGAFEIEEFDEYLMAWLYRAHDGTNETPANPLEQKLLNALEKTNAK